MLAGNTSVSCFTGDQWIYMALRIFLLLCILPTFILQCWLCQLSGKGVNDWSDKIYHLWRKISLAVNRKTQLKLSLFIAHSGVDPECLVFSVSICQDINSVTAFRCLLANHKWLVKTRVSHCYYEVQTDILWLSVLCAILVDHFQD